MTLIQRHNVKISGSGERAVVFAQGFGCDQNMWKFVAPAFEKDFRVILLDYIGAGSPIFLPIDRRNTRRWTAMPTTSWRLAMNLELAAASSPAIR